MYVLNDVIYVWVQRVSATTGNAGYIERGIIIQF